MKIHWNWGTKLLIAIIVFMTFIFVLVYFTAQHDIMLVEKDYYPKGLKFQDRIDERNNAKALRSDFLVSQTPEFVKVELPDIKPDTGSLVFYRHNDNKLDMTFLMDTSDLGDYQIPLTNFEKGKYLVKLHWYENEVGYYIEKPFFFNN